MGATLWGWGCQNGRSQESRLGPPWLSTFKAGYESRMFFSRAWGTPEDFFFHIYSSVGYHRLLFQLVGGVSDNRLISPVFLSLLSDRSLPDKGFMYIILICIFKVLLGLPRWC